LSHVYLSIHEGVELIHQSSKGLKLSVFVSLKGDAWLKRGGGNLFAGGVVPLTSFFSVKMI
jgi:hypothetical protein